MGSLPEASIDPVFLKIPNSIYPQYKRLKKEVVPKLIAYLSFGVDASLEGEHRLHKYQ